MGFSMDNKHWILRPDHSIEEVDMMTWAQWLGTSERILKQEDTKFFWISTVFLGINHSWGSGPPLLFETMSFHKECVVKELLGRLHRIREEDMCVRYSSYDDAMTGHDAMVRRYFKQEEIAEKVTK